MTSSIAGHYSKAIPKSIPTVKLRIYAIVVTVVLVAVLTNPSAERHYENLAQFYPWVNESRLADARMEVWNLSPPSEREKWLPYDSLTNDDYGLFLIYTSWGILSFVQCDERYPPCGNDGGPSKPISIGFLGYLYAERPPTPEDLEKRRERETQAEFDRLPRGIASRSTRFEGTPAIAQAPTPPSTTTSNNFPSRQSVGSVAELIRTASQPPRHTRCFQGLPEVEVMRGGTVEIPLPVSKGNFKQLAYSIIGEPRYGRFSNLPQQIVPSGHGPVRVTYTHGNDKNSMLDVLVYEIHSTPSNQLRDRGHRGQGPKPLRGRGRVVIRILDAPPVSGASLPPKGGKTSAVSATTKALIRFGDIPLGAAEEEFLRANPLAKLVKEAPNPDEAVKTYSLLPPDSVDSDRLKFIFRDSKLTQIDHEFDPARSDKKSAATWQEGLSRLFGNEGELYQPDPNGPSVISARKWLSPATGEAATLQTYGDGSARVSFYRVAQ